MRGPLTSCVKVPPLWATEELVRVGLDGRGRRPGGRGAPAHNTPCTTPGGIECQASERLEARNGLPISEERGVVWMGEAEQLSAPANSTLLFDLLLHARGRSGTGSVRRAAAPIWACAGGYTPQGPHHTQVGLT